MKKLRNMMVLVAALGMATLFTGCGDDDNNDNNNNPPANNFAPATAAELQSATKTYTVNVDGNTTTIQFPQSQSYTAQDQNGTQTGTTSTPVKNGNIWTFVVTPDAGQTNATAGTVELNFTSANAGTYRLTETGTGTVHNGNFTVQDNGGTTNGGTDGTTNGGTDGTTNGGTNGSTHPTTLGGKQLQVQTSGAGQELFTMQSDTAFTSDIGASGNYVYTLTGDTAHFTTDYTAPTVNADDAYDLTLTFTSANAGTFTGDQFFSGEHHATSGNFTISQP